LIHLRPVDLEMEIGGWDMRSIAAVSTASNPRETLISMNSYTHKLLHTVSEKKEVTWN
jgi:hypothetical protein